MSQKVTKAKDIVINRQKKVAELFFLRNYTVKEIAKILGWQDRTIWRDIGKIRETGFKQIKELDVRNILFKIINTRNKVLQKLWSAYDKTKDSKEQVITLAKIDDIESKNIKDLQELSVIPKPTERHEVVERKEELIAKFNFIIEHGHKHKDTKDKLLQESKLQSTAKTE